MSADRRGPRRDSGRPRLARGPGPTRERWRRAKGFREIADVETGPAAARTTARVHRLSDGAPVDRLLRRGVLDARQHEAGNRYAADWLFAGLAPRTTVHYGETVAGDGERSELLPGERQVQARRRLRGARAALGIYLAKVAEAILIDELEPADAGRRLFGRKDAPQARASATDALRIALDTLADHYGL